MVRRGIYESFSRDKRGYMTVKSLKSVLDKAVAENAPVIFMCRKAYWLYRTLRCYSQEWDKKYGKLVILSNRLIMKEPDELLNKGYHAVYVFDDTVNTGRSLYQIYKILKAMKPEFEVRLVVACAPESKETLKEKLIVQEKGENPRQIEEFFKALSIGYYVNIDEIGWISSQEIYMYQRELIPYVIELPFMKEETDTKIVQWTDKNPYVINLRKEIFRSLCISGTQWDYVDNSYFWPDRLENGRIDRVIHCGFFHYHNIYVDKSLGDYAPELIVKCRYEETEEGKIQAVFTPFAVMDSISMEEAWKMFSCFYMNTHYFKKKKEVYDFLQRSNNNTEEYRQSREQLGVAVFRANVFFFSLYVYRVFERMVSRVINCSLVLDDEYMKESFSEDFIKYVDKVSKWEPEDFLNKIRRLEPISKISVKNQFRNIRYEYIKNDAEGMLAQVRLEILRRKREKSENIFIPIEEIKDYVFDKTLDKDLKTRNQILLSIILQMTDQSVIGNSLKVDEKNRIYRGYRYGENSDVVLPFRNTYIQLVVETFYDNCQMISGYNSDKARQIYFKLIEVMFRELKAWVKEQNYLDVFVSRQELEWGSLYYSDKQADIDTLINNKTMLMKDGRDGIMEMFFLKWIDGFSNSWGDDWEDIKNLQ